MGKREEKGGKEEERAKKKKKVEIPCSSKRFGGKENQAVIGDTLIILWLAGYMRTVCTAQ